MISWVIETGIEPDYEKRLSASAKKVGFNVIDGKYFPFKGLEMDFVKGPALFHGSLQGASAAKERGLTVWENEEQLKCSYYYPRLGSKEAGYLLSKEFLFIPFGCLNNKKQFLIDTLGEDGCVFIRPDSGCKQFNGQIVDSRTWDKDLEIMGLYDVQPEEICVVARPQPIADEYRFFVSGDKIITGSRYTKNKKSVRENVDTLPIFDFCNNRIKGLVEFTGYNPSPMWVADFCMLEGGEIYILEVGPFSSSGLYECDTDKIATAAKEILNG